MTTTASPPADAPAPSPDPCPKCGAALARVPDTDVDHCDSCGFTRGEARAADAVVTPDEVAGPGNDLARPADVDSSIDHNEALEQAVEDAMLMAPGVPGRDEFLTLAQTARMLSMSPLVPKFLRGNPAACFHLAMIGRDLGISPTSAVELIDVIPESRNDPNGGGRASLSPELLNAQIKRMGLGSIVPLAKTADRAVAVALAPGGKLDRRCVAIGRHFLGAVADFVALGLVAPDDDPARLAAAILPLRPLTPLCACEGILGEYEFTWEDARTAGLVQAAGRDYGADHGACMPGAHQPYLHNGNGRSWTKCDCNQGYITYPKRMLWWRASGFIQSDVMPEASLGLYSAEELGSQVDENGRMLDPATVALPEGYEPEAPPPAPPSPPADADAVESIRARLAALSEEGREEALRRWKDEVIEPLSVLTAAGAPRVRTLLARIEHEFPPPPAEAPAETPPVAPPAPAEATDAPPVDDPPSAAVEPADDNPGKPAPEGMALHLAVQFGRREPFLTEDLAERAIRMVTNMTPAQVNGQLRGRALETAKLNEDTRRANLARVLALEFATLDWQEANRED